MRAVAAVLPLPTGGPATAPARACAHCGLPVPAALRPAGDEPAFCCGGCRHVYAVLKRAGLDRFYRIRDADGSAGVPARVTGRAFEDYDGAAFSTEHVDATGRGTCRTAMYLEGVHCAACVWLVERLPAVVPGLVSVRLDLPRSRADLEWDPDRVRLSAVARALDGLGYVPHPFRGRDLDRLRRAEDRGLLVRVGVAAACAMNVMMLQGALYAGEVAASGMDGAMVAFLRWTALLVTLPVVLFCAVPFWRGAWAGLRHGVPHVDLPIALALAVAFAASAAAVVAGSGPIWFDSLDALVALLLLARFVQGRAQRAALERTESLRGAAFVEFARRLDADGTSREVPSGTLAAGDRVEVLSGETLPADGIVAEGASTLDNAVLTGEPQPVPVARGAAVNAGATNLGARLVVEVRAAGAATRMGALLRLVEDAMAHKAPIVAAADRLSRWFVGAVLALAAVTAALWWQRSPADALVHVIALLVVTCPCALALGTPVALTVALSRAARAGIFVKDAGALEKLGGVATIVLDKTGTLTQGRAAVAGSDLDAAAAGRLASLEASSSHPIARAIAAAFEASGAPVADVREAVGRGIEGRVGGVAVAAGTRAFLASLGVALPDAALARAAAIAARGLSPVLVAEAGSLAGVVAVGDPIRPDAAATVRALRDLGWRPILASGDHPDAVAAVARALGLPAADARGGLSPEDKCDLVRSLVRDPARPGRVLMVGDGVNDAAALALADVGVSVAGGTGASIVAADVVLTRGGLAPLLALRSGAARTMRRIRVNLLISLCYNATGAALAMTGLVGPLLAAVLMPASSLSVVLSSVLGRSFATPSRPPAAGGTRWS